MSELLSADTKAILLLTAPLIAGPKSSKSSVELLKPQEYARLARHLHRIGGQPADLLGPQVKRILDQCSDVVDGTRIERLLARGFLLSQAVERWRTRAIWVISRADPGYPQKLKSRLKSRSPAVLYGCGERDVVDTGGIAVVGSRNADDSLIEYTRNVGRLVAASRKALISGGARGIDQAAMDSALEYGGLAVGVLADNLGRRVVDRKHRNMLLERRLVLISPFDPSAGFNVGNAMRRNKVIYALADAALIVNADMKRGGTWSGATEQLEKIHQIPIYVRSTGARSDGLDALKQMGAMEWPNPEDSTGLDAALSRPANLPRQQQLSLIHGDATGSQLDTNGTKRGVPFGKSERDDRSGSTADELWRTVRSIILRVVQRPKSTQDIAKELGVTRTQASKWLAQMADEGLVEKQAKPVRYKATLTDFDA